jgi:dihydroorotate dehydrogenase (fumarate)
MKFPRILNASGCWVISKSQMNNLIKETGLKVIISKTCTLYPEKGNPKPNYFNGNGFSLNCMGMPNKGFYYYQNLWKYYKERNIKYIISLDTSNLEDLIYMVVEYDDYIGLHKNSEDKDLIELNLSCPNVSNRLISYNPYQLEKLLEVIGEINTKYIGYGLKLSPIIDSQLLEDVIGIINRNHRKYGKISYVVASNTIPNGCILDSEGNKILSRGYGGISGTPLKLISLGMVEQLKRGLLKDIKIMGCGGVECDKDVVDYRKMGADGVQVGRAIMNGNLEVFKDFGKLKCKM